MTGATAYGMYSRPDWKESLGSGWSSVSSRLGIGQSKKDFSALITDTARQAPFQISVQVAGHVDSSGNAVLSCLVEGSTTIISIVPEGTMVKKGDVVCELDSSALREKYTLQEIKSSQADAGLVTAEKNLEILLRQNETDIEAVKLKMRLADLDLDKFENGEYPKSVNMLGGNVAIAEEDLLRIKESYELTKLQVKKGARTQNDLESERIAVKQAELKLKTAVEELKVLKEFDYNRKIAELKANSLEFKRELERTTIKCDAAVVQGNEDIKTKKLTAEAEKTTLDRWRRQIEACTMHAPQDGEVVYANLQNSNSRGGSTPETITEGAQVRERQAIINLPDITQMKVDCRIHESQIAAVRRGLPVRIRIEAFPDRPFNGTVTEVSSVPITGRWPNMDLREYDTEIKLTDDVEILKTLRPGLTAQVEILVDNREDVLQVPVQSLVSSGGKHFAFVLTEDGPQQRDLAVGQSNQTHVEVKEGIKPGERVVMNPRSRFVEQIAAIEAAVTKEMAKKAAGLKIPAGGPNPGAGAPPFGTTPGAAGGPGGPGGPVAAGGPGAGGPGGAPGGRGPGGGGPGGPGGGAPGGSNRSPQERFASMDMNKDGKLSADEVPAFMKDRLSQMDTDGNGEVSQSEFVESAQRNARNRPMGQTMTE